MSGLNPFFITGDKVRIRIDGKTVAFATDLMCSIQITHQTPHVLGMYEPTSVEPLSYNISGTFTVIRYVKNAIANIGGSVPYGVNSKDVGNSASTFGSDTHNSNNGLSNLGVAGAGGRAYEALDPSTYSQGTTFDIEVYQKAPNDVVLGIIKIRSARITKADFSVSKRTPGIDRFEFVALYVDGDVSQAKPSGVGQQNT